MRLSSTVSLIVFPSKIPFQQQFCVSRLLKYANFWTHELCVQCYNYRDKTSKRCKTMLIAAFYFFPREYKMKPGSTANLSQCG